MYILMYAMVDTIANVYNSLNQIYMAALMTAPMVLIELALMGEMYPNKGFNKGIAALSVIAGLGFFLLIRQQVAIIDTQFLRSMIPHHSGAILMCAKAPIRDTELKALCKTIMTSQDAEIKQMRSMLER